MTAFILPDLGEGLHEAALLEWHVAVGDRVAVDQVLVSVETAKAIVDVPSPWAGRVSRLGAGEGEIVKVGQTLVEMDREEPHAVVPSVSVSVVGELLDADKHNGVTEQFFIGATPIKHVSCDNSAKAHQSGPVIRPAVLAFAQQLGVAEQLLYQSETLAEAMDHAAVVGLFQALQGNSAQTQARDLKYRESGGQLKGARRQMALTSAKSNSEVAAVTLFDEVVFDPAAFPVDVSAACIRALASACQQFPLFNAWYDGETMTLDLRPEVDIGLAVDTRENLLVPVLRSAERMSLAQCRSEVNRLVCLCHERKIAPRDMQGATISLSNFGMLSGQFATPMIVPPQVAILAVGCAIKRPFVVSKDGIDRIVIAQALPLSLSFDHRVATGGEAARFLMAIKRELLQAPGIDGVNN